MNIPYIRYAKISVQNLYFAAMTRSGQVIDLEGEGGCWFVWYEEVVHLIHQLKSLT